MQVSVKKSKKSSPGLNGLMLFRKASCLGNQLRAMPNQLCAMPHSAELQLLAMPQSAEATHIREYLRKIESKFKNILG
jgi:hypothetical protein